MKLRKTDRRFNLYQYGFDCYVEFDINDWHEYNRTVCYCRDNLGPGFWHFKEVMFAPTGKWKGVSRHRNKRGYESKRIYFRGEKYYTLLLMALPQEDKNTVYL